MTLAWTFPIILEFMTWWQASLLSAAVGLPVVLLGLRSMAGLGPTRQWVAIGLRLVVLLLLVLIVAGARWQRINRDVEVIVLSDISRSTSLVRNYPGETLDASIDQFVREVADKNKQRQDRIGMISFASSPLIDAMPNTTFMRGARAVRDTGTGTDIASAIQLAMATLKQDAMHRLVLISDGNANQGDLESAISLAASANVPIDTIPLRYDVTSEVVIDKFVAPTWRRENEPFTLEVILNSTNPRPVTGRLVVTHQGTPIDLDPSTPGVQAARAVTLQSGANVERVKVPALRSQGVHPFKAIFEPDGAAAGVDAAVGGAGIGGGGVGGGGGAGRELTDTIIENNQADSFTFVRGRGEVLYVDSARDDGGRVLAEALRREGIEIRPANVIAPEQFPVDLIALQNYDAVILNNVSRGQGGLNETQQQVLASYVHELGGGLVMVGGEDAFGAGGWSGSRLEEVLPINMDVPAQRQLPKGALVLLMHSCEMPEGNYWGEQCAIKAVETLSARDEVGVLSYDWGGGGSQWDFPLQEKGDGSRVTAAIKRMKLGDMPSFDDSIDVALNGKGGMPGLKDTNARQKHIIVISDGDPALPRDELIKQAQSLKVSISTVTVYPHPGMVPDTMTKLAQLTGGRSYGPINDNPEQLPQIFIKEATIVRRSLIFEDKNGIALRTTPTISDLMKGVEVPGLIYGLVLTSRKQSPQVEVPIVAGKNNDPVLAYWQTGLGRAVTWTSDAHNKWAAAWVGSSVYDKFWAQVVRSVSRPPMSSDLDVTTTIEGTRGKIVVEALDRDTSFKSFLNIRGTVVGPDLKPREVRLVQTGPGVYTAEFDTTLPGNYVVSMRYSGPDDQQGFLLSGVAMNAAPELRDLRSSESVLRRIADATGGRVLPAFDIGSNTWFDREGLKRTAAPLAVWDILIPIALAMLIIDVAARRIAWDYASIRRYALAAVGAVQGYTHTTRKVESTQSLDALKTARGEAREKIVAGATGKAPAGDAGAAPARPDPKAKFEAGEGVEGDISMVVGGAADQPTPSGRKPAGGPGGDSGSSLDSLMEAKRRAQRKMEQDNQ